MSVQMSEQARSKGRRVALGEILTLVNGRAYKQAELLNEGTPIIRIQNLNGGDRWYYSDLVLPDDKYCVHGDLLFAWSGTFGPYFWRGSRSIYHYHIWKVIPSEKLDKKFAFYLLDSITIRVKSAGRGISMIHMTKAGMEAWEVDLPPLDEQKRIAAILDKADALRRQRRQALALLDSLTQSIFLEMFGDPVSNPKGWREATLGEALAEIGSGWSPNCLDREATPEEWGVLKLSAVTSGHFIESEQKALPEVLEPKCEIEIRPDDVLFTRKNTYSLVAACALVWNVRARLMISDLIFRLVIRDSRHLLPSYLWSCLSNSRLRSKIQLLAGGAAGSMPNISKEKLRAFRIPIPDVQSQELFDERARRVVRKQQELSTHSQQLDSLFASLQHRAFSGQL